ncbi:MAG: hypothetical protein STSR0009_11720 [Methanoregula sp.]
MPEDYTKKLQTLLRKLFQFESADLDFGIYRINRADFDPSSRIPKTGCSKPGFFSIPGTTGHPAADSLLERT